MPQKRKQQTGKALPIKTGWGRQSLRAQGGQILKAGTDFFNSKPMVHESSGASTKAFFATSAAPLGAPQTLDINYDQPASQPLRHKKPAKKPREVSETAFAPSARAKAMLRGVEIAEADLRDSGGAFELEDVQKLLRGVSRQSVEKKVREGALLAVPGPSNRRRYPTIQFDDGALLPGLKEVQAALPTRNGWSVLNFLIHPNSLLDQRRPIDLIKAGEVDLVVKAAARKGEMGG